MSYDIQVYGHRYVELTSEFVAGVPGLTVGALGTDGIEVLRGARCTYAFAVDGPLEIDAEDVPDDVLAHVLEPRWLWTILVQGSSPAETPVARKFAKQLAVAAEGAALDPQTGELITKTATRAATVPPKDTRISVVELSWYGPDVPGQTDDWLELCARYLPEASPRHFGAYEPLQGRLDRDGPTALRELTEEDDLVSFRASRPFLEGSFQRRTSILQTEIDLHATALYESDWQAAVRRLFIAYAERRRAFLAIGEVVRGVGWNGRSTWYDGKGEKTTSVLDQSGRYRGLKPYPVWWTWFGDEYRRLVEPHLNSAEVTDRPAGIFHQAAPVPTRRSKLTDPLPRELRHHRDPTTRRWVPASIIPGSLQTQS